MYDLCLYFLNIFNDNIIIIFLFVIFIVFDYFIIIFQDILIIFYYFSFFGLAVVTV